MSCMFLQMKDVIDSISPTDRVLYPICKYSQYYCNISMLYLLLECYVAGIFVHGYIIKLSYSLL